MTRDEPRKRSGGPYRSGRESRERLLQTAGELFQERGFSGTGLNEILARSGAPRGSLYHHFPGGKTELGVAALAAAGQVISERLAAAFQNADSVDAAVGAVYAFFRSELEDSEFRKACPVAAVAQGISEEHSEIREACARVYASWETELAGYLSAGSAAPEATRLARELLMGLEGALLLAKTRRDSSYLDLAEAQARRLLA